MAPLRFYYCLLLLNLCLSNHDNHALASPQPLGPSLSNRSPNPNSHRRGFVFPHVDIPPVEPMIPPTTPHVPAIEPMIPPTTPHNPIPEEPAPIGAGEDPKPTPMPSSKPEDKPDHQDGQDGPDSSSASPTSTSKPRYSSRVPALLPMTGLPAAVIVGNTTITAGASAVVIAGHTVAYRTSSVLAVDNTTTTLVPPRTDATASAAVVAGLTVQPVPSASDDVGSGISSPSSGPGSMSFSSASRLSFELPWALIYLYGPCVLALLFAQGTVQIVR